MRNILNEAILFDMYYMTRATSNLQKANIPPVNEGTPQFRNFYVNNVVCNGASKALLVRGLPEMSIKGIHLENMTFKTKVGAELIEAKDISLKNITFDVKDPKQLIYIENSSDITLDHIRSLSPTDLFVSINGDRSGKVEVTNTNITNAKAKSDFRSGADSKVLIMK